MAAQPTRGGLLYEGKAKRVFETTDGDALLVEFKDDATAFNGTKRGQIRNKGEVNARISAELFRLLAQRGIPTHFREQVDARTLLVDRLRMVKLEVVVRNRVAGSLFKRTGLPEGSEVVPPVVECYFKNDALGDPLLNDDHIRLLGLARPEELRAMREQALAVNRVLDEFFEDRGVLLVDFKLEFGYFHGVLKLGDEISPDTCRFWDRKTRARLDKDRFRQELPGVEEAYQEMLRRVLQ